MSKPENDDHAGQPSDENRSWLQLYLHGLGVSVRGNAQAFGFSILITVSYGIVSAASDRPAALELVGFALAAVAAFALMNILVAWLKTIQPDDMERSHVLLVATATDFLAVGAGLGAAFAATALFDGWARWVVAPFAASMAYGLVQALEIAVTRHESDNSD